ncbi:MAG: hypothetical protein CMF12_03630 [Idiomarina sp.]|uniref:hypothetical protein n=1 Tax=Idiomarina sp. TaxID=1874361 RepID=UPI000C39F5C8|nr:hypothetical protein [Idiomarina sp.]MBT41596.1 hypothetical protein [Idiomarina sp.]
MTPPERLRNLLLKVRDSLPNEEFCGVGVVVSRDIQLLPIASLCTDASLPAQQDLVEQIAECSLRSRSCHDGFQILSDKWQLIQRNQYFAPFPPADFRELIGSVNVGSRHMAARFGSLIESVVCTGLLSERDGVIVFEGGQPLD